MEHYLKQMEAVLRARNYSNKTIKAYLRCLSGYFYFKKVSFDKFDSSSVYIFLESKQKAGLSGQTINLYLQSIKFFYREVLGVSDPIYFRVSKVRKRLPVVLSKEEIQRVLDVVVNTKHYLLVAISYCAGLRVSEVVNLQVQDIDLNQKIIVIRSGKGNKDRISLLSEKICDDLSEFIDDKSVKEYLFVNKKGKKITTRTAQKVFTNACMKAGLRKNVSFHSLRHSFATHLLEDGVDIRYIQKLLGHQNIRTTQKYTQVTNPGLRGIKSPL